MRVVEAARVLASVRAWPLLCTVLGNLGMSPAPDATSFLAQALWLSLRVELPATDLLGLSAALLQKCGLEAPVAPLLAATAFLLVQARAGEDPQCDQLQEGAADLLRACASARAIEADKLEAWLASECLNDPARLLPAVNNALEELVDAARWLFDRHLFGKGSAHRRTNALREPGQG